MRIKLILEVDDEELRQALAPLLKRDESRELEPLLKAEEVAELLNIGRSTIYELLADGRLPSIRVGHLVRVTPSAVWDYIEKGGG